ncbi:MAG: DUF1667 domain-containing protein [Clostridia bacterium]|nr:DUF1667 domain-containing protein [Clostridia bacterium]
MVVQRFKTCPRCSNGCMITYLEEAGRIITIKGAACPKGEGFIYETVAPPDSLIDAVVYVKNGIVSTATVRTSKPVPGPMVDEFEKAMKKLELEAPLEFGKVAVENFMNSGIDIISRTTVKKYIQ